MSISHRYNMNMNLPNVGETTPLLKSLSSKKNKLQKGIKEAIQRANLKEDLIRGKLANKENYGVHWAQLMGMSIDAWNVLSDSHTLQAIEAYEDMLKAIDSLKLKMKNLDARIAAVLRVRYIVPTMRQVPELAAAPLGVLQLINSYVE